MYDFLDVVGDDIYCGSHKVATFDPSVWSTLRSHVEAIVRGDNDQSEEVKGLEETIDRLKDEIKEADRRTEAAEDILLEIGEDANCFATGRVLLAMQDKLLVAEQEIELLRAQLSNKSKKRK